MGLYDSADYSDGGWTRPDNLLFFLLQRFFKRYFFSESVRLLIVFCSSFCKFLPINLFFILPQWRAWDREFSAICLRCALTDLHNRPLLTWSFSHWHLTYRQATAAWAVTPAVSFWFHVQYSSRCKKNVNPRFLPFGSCLFGYTNSLSRLSLGSEKLPNHK